MAVSNLYLFGPNQAGERKLRLKHQSMGKGGSSAKEPKKLVKAQQQALLSKIAHQNPFEKRGVNKKKHEVFNRRVKGEGRNVAKARSEAVERRNHTLLVDWQKSKKSNTFEDKRFGEHDATLPLEEKMWARLQKERSRVPRSSRSSAFNLDDDGDDGDDEDLLTHKGKALSNADGFQDFGRAETEADDDANLNAEMVDRLHFGGGQQEAGNHYGPGDRKSRKEIMEEIIAKSKQRKAEKSRAKDEQEDAREKLDAEFGDLMGMLQQRPTKAGSAAVPRAPMDEYDRMTKELAFEGRVQATDRTKTPEEIAKAAAEELQELEVSRLKRMKGITDSDDETGRDGKKSKGKKRQRNDDELGVDFAAPTAEVATPGGIFAEREAMHKSTDASQGRKSKTDKYGNTQAGGDSDAEAGEFESDGSSDGSEQQTDDELSGSDVMSDEDGNGAEQDANSASDDALDAESLDLSAEQEAQLEQRAAKRARTKASAAKEMPYVLPCPGTMEQLLELLAQHATSAQDCNTLIERILKCHSVKADKRNAEKIHNFYDVLLKRFQRLGDQAATLPAGGAMDRRVQLDFLVRALHSLTQDIPEAAGSLWHRLLGAMQVRLAKELRNRAAGADATAAPCWPSPGHRLLLKLLGDLFPTTDFRHSVTSPAILLIGQYLSQCPVQTSADLSAGVFLSAVMLQASAPAHRLAPEALCFLTSTAAQYCVRPVCSASPKGHGSESFKAQSRAPLSAEVAQLVGSPTFADAPLGWLRLAAAGYSTDDSHEILPVDLRWGTHDDRSRTVAERSRFATSLLGTVYSLLEKSISALDDLQGLPEVAQPVQAILSRIRPMDTPALPVALQERHLQLQETIAGLVDASLQSRAPLRWQNIGVQTIKALAPKFQETYRFNRDGDVDAEQAQVKQLKRQLKRERKGAMRELKRDADYLEAAKVKEMDQKRDTRKKALRANLTWLEQEQGTWNQQVGSKSTRRLIKGGGSSAKRRPTIGRVT